MSRIVDTSVSNEPYPDEKFLTIEGVFTTERAKAQYFPSEAAAEAYCKALNRKFQSDKRIFKAVPDSYFLKGGNPN